MLKLAFRSYIGIRDYQRETVGVRPSRDRSVPSTNNAMLSALDNCECSLRFSINTPKSISKEVKFTILAERQDSHVIKSSE